MCFVQNQQNARFWPKVTISEKISELEMTYYFPLTSVKRVKCHQKKRITNILFKLLWCFSAFLTKIDKMLVFIR